VTNVIKVNLPAISPIGTVPLQVMFANEPGDWNDDVSRVPSWAIVSVCAGVLQVIDTDDV
jgi:hypothetical protein